VEQQLRKAEGGSGRVVGTSVGEVRVLEGLSNFESTVQAAAHPACRVVRTDHRRQSHRRGPSAGPSAGPVQGPGIPPRLQKALLDVRWVRALGTKESGLNAAAKD
jgi:hypothetical protein